MSKFTDVALVPRESVDVETGAGSLDAVPGTDLRANVQLSRCSPRVSPRDSREAARDEFEHSVRISSVVKSDRALRERDKKEARLPRWTFGAHCGVRVSRTVRLD